MDSYKVYETATFQADLVFITRSGLEKLKAKLLDHIYPQLRIEPHFGSNIKKLKDWEPSTWRYRVGSWRFFYELDEKAKIIYMTAADHRSRAYKK